jgi:hypothetical protein
MDGDVKGHRALASRKAHRIPKKDNAAGANPSPSDYFHDSAFFKTLTNDHHAGFRGNHGPAAVQDQTAKSI